MHMFYSPDCTITPMVSEHSFTVSSPLGRISTFSAARTNHSNSGKGKGKGICLEVRYIHVTTHVLQTVPPLAVDIQQPATIDPTLDLCTRYPLRLVNQGSMEYEVCPTLLHMSNAGNQTPDLLILSPAPYPLGHMLPQFCIFVPPGKHYCWMGRSKKFAWHFCT